MGTVANVLVGVATLSIQESGVAVADWSGPGYGGESHSAKLLKTGLGGAGSTYVQFIPPTGITLGTITWEDYGFWHFAQNIAVNANWCHMEFRFEEPNGVGWVELTALPMQGEPGAGAWDQEDLTDTTPSIYCGVGEGGVGFSELAIPATLIQNSGTDITDTEAAVTDASGWVLVRIRIELWEAAPARYIYIGEVEIATESCTVSPGGSAPGMTLGSPHTEIGYTEDGVTLEYTADTADIEVEEETFPIDRVITKETLAVTCNMAESSLYNMDKAMAGSVLSGTVITIGAGVNKEMNLKIEGTNPAGYYRTILLPRATATGIVGMSYKKGEKTVIPVTFQALKPATGSVCTIVDNIA